MRNKVAGITGSTKLSWKMDTSEVRRVMEINFMGTFLNCVEAIPGMIEKGRGRIINISSIA